jgi:exo-beta-1,3-glucanase (GH17 family)
VARPADGNSLPSALAHYALTALAIGIAWWWLGKPVQLPPSPLASGGKLYCVSYAPFRDSQDPLVPGTMVSAEQIEQDLALLSRYTDCIRTYSNANGLDQIPAIAQRHGLKMLMGLWLANSTAINRQQIATAIDLAKKYPDVIQ